MSDTIDEKKRIEPAVLKPTRWDWFALILPLIALAPMLWFQSKLLWNRPHLQFFPMALNLPSRFSVHIEAIWWAIDRWFSSSDGIPSGFIWLWSGT